jgi:hypothetical protein
MSRMSDASSGLLTFCAVVGIVAFAALVWGLLIAKFLRMVK